MVNMFTVYLQNEAAVRVDPKIRSMSDLMLKVYGQKGKLAADFVILSYFLGLDVMYLMYNGVQIDQLV